MATVNLQTIHRLPLNQPLLPATVSDMPMLSVLVSTCLARSLVSCPASHSAIRIRIPWLLGTFRVTALAPACTCTCTCHGVVKAGAYFSLPSFILRRVIDPSRLHFLVGFLIVGLSFLPPLGVSKLLRCCPSLKTPPGTVKLGRACHFRQQATEL
jgi:hypothetical protein